MSNMTGAFLRLLTGNLAAIILQGFQFILLARALGPGEYGEFSSALSIVMITMPFAGFGMANVIIMRGATAKSTIAANFTAAVVATILSGLVLSVIAVLVAKTIFSIDMDWWSLALIVSADLIFTKIVDTGTHAYLADDKPGTSGLLLMVAPACRLISIVALSALERLQLNIWAYAYFASAMAAACVAFLVASRRYRLQLSGVLYTIRKEWREAVFFAVGLSARSAYTDGDKLLLARAGNPELVGIYAVASRFALFAIVPIRTLALAAQTRYFRAGGAGLAEAKRFGLQTLGFYVLYGTFVGAALYFGSPLLVLVMGPAYAESSKYLAYLAFLPLLTAIQTTLSDSLTGLGYQKQRSLCQVGAAAVLFILGSCALLSDPGRSVVLAVFCSQFVLIASLLIVLAVIKKAE